MVGNRRPPPPAPPAIPPSSRAKDYKTDRPSEVQDELDMLRSRGMAKILNRHFTDTTKKLAKEKAQADAALADLERRRAQTSEFVPSKGGDLNPFDSMYVELQHKRAACRRKEKETMLLYQRYVHKYGKKAKIEPPLPAALKEKEPAEEPPTKSLSSMPVVDEASESVVSDDVKFSKFYNKQISERGKDEPPPDPPAIKSMDPPGTKTKGADPPVEISTPEAEVPDLQALTPQTSRDTESSRQEESVEPVMVKVLTPPTLVLDNDDATEDAPIEPPAIQMTDDAEEKTPTETKTETTEAVSTEDTTPVEAKEPPAVSEEINQDTKQEDPEVASDESECENRPAREVTTEIPSTACTSDDDESDIRSIISGLTSVNSLNARQLMDEVVNEMDIFIKTETEDIRKQLEEEEKTSTGSFGNSSGSVMCDESVMVTLKAEAMAQEMQKILYDFKKDDSSAVASNASKTGSEEQSAASSSNYPRKLETPNADEEWMVYYDESYKREYYFEKRTNRTQWDKPSTSLKTRREEDALSNQMMSEALSPRGEFKRKQSRKSLYRKRMRKRRIRRYMFLSVLILCIGISVWHWQTCQPEKSYQEALKLSTSQLFDYAKEKIEYSFTDRKIKEKESARAKAEREAKLERERKMELENEREEAKRKEAERIAKEKAELKAKEEAERKAKVEAERKAREEAERKAKAEAEEKARELAERKAREEAERKAKAEAERKAREEAERKAKEEAERREMEKMQAAKVAAEEYEKALKRPWGCNLPLAYIVHGRCRRLARENPIYREDDLVNSFLQ